MQHMYMRHGSWGVWAHTPQLPGCNRLVSCYHGDSMYLVVASEADYSTDLNSVHAVT